MRRRDCCVAALALLSASGLQAQEPARAFVEVQPAADTVWLREACEVRVVIGFDAEWFARAAVPLFQQRLDQPFQVQVPWLVGAEDRAVALVPTTIGVATQRIAVGDRVVAAAQVGTRDIDGRRFELLELRYRWLPLAAGTATIAPVELRFAFATRFDDDFLRGRQPLDRQEQSVRSPALRLQVRALPVRDRPPSFTGAVGEFTITVRTAASELRVGREFVVEVEIAGDGDLDRMAPLPPPVLPGFHVQGVRELPRGTGRTFELSLLPLRAGVRELPPIPLASFSPRAGAYVEQRSQPLPLRVEPLPAGLQLLPAIADLVRDDERALRAANAWPWWSYLLGVVALAALAGWLLARTRGRRQRARWPAALAQLEAALASGPGPTLVAFERVCAVRAGRLPFASGHTWPALAAAGVVAAAVAQAQAMHGALDAARFGGQVPAAAAVLASARAIGPP